MSRWAQGQYVVRHPEKYVGKSTPRYRSGWELAFMKFCDDNDNVLQWASEAISVPYRHPLTGRISNYVPDFFVQYRTKNNVICSEIVEIKPKKQSVIESKMSSRDRAVVAVNYAKWNACQIWCRRAGLVFRVINEDQIFRNSKANAPML
jgi:hypothetical protein